MNNSVRLIIGALLALPVAGGLFFIMQYMIATADPQIDDSNTTKLADIHMPEVEIETNINEKKPDKPDDPEEPPPEFETPDVDVDLDVELVNVAPAAQIELNISGSGISASDGEFLPIMKAPAIYPRRASERGIEGYCTVEYTVTAAGSVRDPVVVDCSSPVFERASIKAALKFKYKPRVVDDEAIEVPGVQNRFLYELEE